MSAQKRHILMISNYFAPDAGAASVRNTRLAHELQQMGHQVTVLTSLPHYPQGRIHDGYRRKMVVIEDRSGVRVVQTWLWATPSSKISRKLISQISFMLMAILRGLFLRRPDVILIEAQPVFTGWAGRILALVMRRPYVLNVSDLWPEHLLSVGALTETNVIYRTARAIVNHMYRRAAMIIAMSPGWASRIQAQIGDLTPVKTVLNGVDLARFKPDLDVSSFRATHDLQAEKLLVFIGTLATQYNFELMLSATTIFAQRDDVQVVIIGDGSQRQLIEKAWQQNTINLVWIDWLHHTEIPVAWNAAYFTFWAMGTHELYEGTIPAKLFEAMACGVPMVVYGRGVQADILNESDAGIAVADGGATALADAINKVVDDEDLRATMAQNARTYAENHFDHRNVTQQYADLLTEASP